MTSTLKTFSCLPTALIDKSLLQAICELDPIAAEAIWKELVKRYQLVVPFILVEEVWVNYGNPGLKDPKVIRSMVETLLRFSSTWIDEELEFAFDELIIKNGPLDKFKPFPHEMLAWLVDLDPRDLALSQWLDMRRSENQRIIRERISEQNSILPPGKFMKAENSEHVFRGILVPKFREIIDDPARRQTLMDKFFGQRFRKRHPDMLPQIDPALRNYTTGTFMRYPFTLHCLMANMLYFYGPLMRVKDGKGYRAILRRSKKAQFGNLADESYNACALACDFLLTRDAEMASSMDFFKAAGLWRGNVIFLAPQQPIIAQIPLSLVPQGQNLNGGQS